MHGERHPSCMLQRARELSRRARMLSNAGRPRFAERAGWAALLLFEAALGRLDDETLDAVNMLAICRFNEGRFAAAAEVYRDLQTRCEVAYGPGDKLTLIAAERVLACLDRCERADSGQAGVDSLH